MPVPGRYYAPHGGCFGGNSSGGDNVHPHRQEVRSIVLTYVLERILHEMNKAREHHTIRAIHPFLHNSLRFVKMHCKRANTNATTTTRTTGRCSRRSCHDAMPPCCDKHGCDTVACKGVVPMDVLSHGCGHIPCLGGCKQRVV